MWAERKSDRVSLCEATHCRSARALQTRFEAWAVRDGGARRGYTETISCRRADMTPASGARFSIASPNTCAQPPFGRSCAK